MGSSECGIGVTWWHRSHIHLRTALAPGPPAGRMQRGDLGRGGAPPVEDLAPADAHGVLAHQRRVEVALHVRVPLARRVVAESTVELDDQPVIVLDVAVDHPVTTPVTHLTITLGQPVWPDDPSQVTVLQDRARPCGDVGQDAAQPGPARGAATRCQLICQPLCGGPSSLHHVGEHPERLEVGDRAAGHVDGRVVVPQARRSDRPHRALVEPVDPLDAYAGRGQDRPRPGHRHLDGRRLPPLARPLVGAQCRLSRERGRPGVEHRRPGPLEPGGVTRVSQVDARVQDRELAAPDQAPDAGRGLSADQQLGPGHDTVLVVEDVGDGPARGPGAW